MTRAQLIARYPNMSESMIRKNLAEDALKMYEQPKIPKGKSCGSSLERKFLQLWTALGGTPLTSEYKFLITRKWRFDFCHTPSKVAIELEGGIWNNGAHVRGTGFIEDCSKYNAASALGFRLFRLTSELITEPDLRQIMGTIARNS